MAVGRPSPSLQPSVRLMSEDQDAPDNSARSSWKYERIAVFSFGVMCVVGLPVMALWIPLPSPWQYAVLRTLLALGAAAVTAFLPGALHVDIRSGVRAGGALGVFVFVYAFSPAIMQEDGLAKRES